MKNKSCVILICAALFCSISCENNIYTNPQKVIVAGKVDNYDPAIPLTISPNRFGFYSESVDVTIDEKGNFHASFETYIPLDAWVTYKTNFLIQLNPNDSLNVAFDGKPNDRPELLSTIRFGGDNAQTNQDIARYQQMYFSDEIYYDWDKKNKAVREYEPEQYAQYNDSVRKRGKDIYDRFVENYSPNKQSRKWASFIMEDDYYNNISFYARDHRSENNMGWENGWDVPIGFYDKMEERLPIKRENLMNAYSLNSFSNRFSSYVNDKLRTKERGEINSWAILPGGVRLVSSDISDSLSIFSKIEYVKDELLLQLMLTDYFSGNFEKQDISAYEKYKDIADQYITEPYLKEPLFELYTKTKERLDNPELFSETILKDVGSSSAGEIFNEILTSNKGKVIYIDFWATWCGPCLSEMPNSKLIEIELKDEDVVFVYICINSDKDKYLATLVELQLGGQQYFLSNEQSNEIKKLFEIQGIPFYILIDQNGIIKDKGSHLRPYAAKTTINDLLSTK